MSSPIKHSKVLVKEKKKVLEKRIHGLSNDIKRLRIKSTWAHLSSDLLKNESFSKLLIAGMLKQVKQKKIQVLAILGALYHVDVQPGTFLWNVVFRLDREKSDNRIILTPCETNRDLDIYLLQTAAQVDLNAADNDDRLLIEKHCGTGNPELDRELRLARLFTYPVSISIGVLATKEDVHQFLDAVWGSEIEPVLKNAFPQRKRHRKRTTEKVIDYIMKNKYMPHQQLAVEVLKSYPNFRNGILVADDIDRIIHAENKRRKHS